MINTITTTTMKTILVTMMAMQETKENIFVPNTGENIEIRLRENDGEIVSIIFINKEDNTQDTLYDIRGNPVHKNWDFVEILLHLQKDVAINMAEYHQNRAQQQIKIAQDVLMDLIDYTN